jgi:hypothetical protein
MGCESRSKTEKFSTQPGTDSLSPPWWLLAESPVRSRFFLPSPKKPPLLRKVPLLAVSVFTPASRKRATRQTGCESRTKTESFRRSQGPTRFRRRSGYSPESPVRSLFFCRVQRNPRVFASSASGRRGARSSRYLAAPFKAPAPRSSENLSK